MSASHGETENRTSAQLAAGSGSLAALPEILDQLGARKTLLVVGPGCTSAAERVRELLGGRSIGSFTDTVAHVPAWQVNLAVASAQEVHADSVVAIGGGSAAGYAKVVALALDLPWVAVPTTLSGAEMTSRYLVTTNEGKVCGRSARAAVRAVVHDQELLAGVPARVLASSGMSAIGACLEILACPRSPASQDAAVAMRRLWEVLPLLVCAQADRELCAHALDAAALAGAALDAAGPGPAQLIAEHLGATHRVDHGSLIACLVPYVGGGVDLDGRVPPPESIREFAVGLGLPVDLGLVCPPVDADALVALLAGRPDLADRVDAESLLMLLKEAVR
jgi:alcohol dehydrogenase class IV